MLGHAKPRIVNKCTVNIENINQIIASPSAKNIYYNVYHPEEAEKKVGIQLKIAIDEIAFANLHSSLASMIQLLNNLKSLIKTENPFNELLSALSRLNEKNEFEIADYKNLIGVINHHKNNLQNYLKKFGNKDPEAQKLMDQILHVWIEGIYLHACIQIDRKEIQDVIFNANSVQLVPHPVAEANMSIPATEAQAIIKITPFEAEQALPPILSILHEVKEIIKNHDLPKTNAAISYSIEILQDANEKLYTPIGEYGKVLGELKTKMLPNLNTLVEKLSDCEFKSELLMHADELTVWLDGLYAHAFNPPERSFLKRKKEESKEWAFKTATGYTKKDISVYYHKGANAVRAGRAKLVNEMELQKAVLATNANELPTTSDSPSSVSKQSKPEVITMHVSDQIELDVKVNNQNLAQKIAALNTPENLNLLNNFFTGKTQLIANNTAAKSLEDEYDLIELEIWNWLNEARFSDDQVKIDTLENIIRKPKEGETKKNYKLVPEQLNRLLYLKGKASTSVEGYKNDTYFKEFLGPLSDKLFPRKHSDVAVQTLSGINKPSFDGDNPQEILEELFASRAKLMEKKKSHTLLPILERLLKEAYVHLLNKIPRLILTERKRQAEMKKQHGMFGLHKRKDDPDNNGKEIQKRLNK